MKASLIVSTFVVFIGALMFAQPTVAQSSPEWNFVSIEDASFCGIEGQGAEVNLERVDVESWGSLAWETVATWGSEVLMDEYFNQGFSNGAHTWGIYDADDRGMQTMSFDDVPPGSTINVTITMWQDDDGGTQMLDQDQFSFVCQTDTQSVPTLGTTSLAVLLLLFLALGGVALQRRQVSIR